MCILYSFIIIVVKKEGEEGGGHTYIEYSFTNHWGYVIFNIK